MVAEKVKKNSENVSVTKVRPEGHVTLVIHGQ